METTTTNRKIVLETCDFYKTKLNNNYCRLWDCRLPTAD